MAERSSGLLSPIWSKCTQTKSRSIWNPRPTARQWVQRSRREGRVHRLEEDVIVENARLRRENQQLRDTNELLKAASAFFASELGPQRRK